MSSTVVSRVAPGALLVLTLSSVAGADLPDLRGTTFHEFTVIDAIGGLLPTGAPIQATTNLAALTDIPHTFEIAADPAFADDPSHILLRTRLVSGSVTGAGVVNPNGIVYFDLLGTYNQVTGAFTVSGTAPGVIPWNISPNTAGIFPVPTDFNVWTVLNNPTLTMTGVVTLEDGLPVIHGTDVTPQFPGPGNLNAGSLSAPIWLLPPDVFSLVGLDPVLSIGNPYYGFAWVARVPGPGATSLLGLLGLGLCKRRR